MAMKGLNRIKYALSGMYTCTKIEEEQLKKNNKSKKKW